MSTYSTYIGNLAPYHHLSQRLCSNATRPARNSRRDRITSSPLSQIPRTDRTVSVAASLSIVRRRSYHRLHSRCIHLLVFQTRLGLRMLRLSHTSEWINLRCRDVCVASNRAMVIGVWCWVLVLTWLMSAERRWIGTELIK
jgi:hypothetical protein